MACNNFKAGTRLQASSDSEEESPFCPSTKRISYGRKREGRSYHVVSIAHPPSPSFCSWFLRNGGCASAVPCVMEGSWEGRARDDAAINAHEPANLPQCWRKAGCVRGESSVARKSTTGRVFFVLFWFFFFATHLIVPTSSASLLLSKEVFHLKRIVHGRQCVCVCVRFYGNWSVGKREWKKDKVSHVTCV